MPGTSLEIKPGLSAQRMHALASLVSVEARFSGEHYATLLRQYMDFVFRRKHGATLLVLLTADLLTLFRALFFGVEYGWSLFFIATGICGFLGFAAYAQERLRMAPLVRYARMIRKEPEMHYRMQYSEESIAFGNASEEHTYQWSGLSGFIFFRENIYLVDRHRKLATCISPVMMQRDEFERLHEFVSSKLKRIR